MERKADPWIASIKPINITSFFRGLPARVPPATAKDERAEARERIALLAAKLNATMLGRELDTRVPRDIEALSETIAERSARYTSDDWSTPHDGRSKLEHAREVVAAIAAEIRGATPDEEWGEDPWADDEQSDEEPET